MRLFLCRTATIAVLVASASPAWAHGGSYIPPAGDVPTGSREPHDPPPPDDGPPGGTPQGEDPPGGPVTPGGGDVGGPGTPPGGNGGPKDGGGPPGTPGGNAGGPLTVGRRGRAGVGFEDWQYWWTHNQSELLALRARMLERSGPLTGSAAHGIGSRGGSGTRTVRATDAAILEQVVPLLRDLLARDDEYFDVRAAAAIALAKIGDVASAPVLCALARGDVKSHKVVSESAALAAGLLEKDLSEVRETLADLASDRSRTGSFARPFAAVGLGFLPAPPDDAAAVRDLLLRVVAGREPGVDAKPACLLALGLRQDRDAVPALLAILRDGRVPVHGAEPLSDLEVSYAVQALGRIGAPGHERTGPTSVVDDLVVAAGRESADVNVRRSAIVALGRVAPAAPPKSLERAIESLVRVGQDGDDLQSRSFALIALGRIGGNARTGDDARRRCVEVLGRMLESGKPASQMQPYAALGLGLVGRGLSDARRGVDEESIRRPLRTKFRDTREPSVRASFAVASGLAGDGRATDALLGVVSDDSANGRLRGYCALALGMIGGAQAVEPVRALVSGAEDRQLRLQASVAAGLLGDARAVAELLAALRDPDSSQYTLGSAAVALGAIGDERAIGPLCDVVRDASRYPDLTRALAVVALGRIGDRRDVPTLSRLASDINYRAQVPAVSELLTIL
jgi:HEAT repeat protein